MERFKSHKRSNTLDKTKNRQIVELTLESLYAGEKLLFQKAQRDNFDAELRCNKKGELMPKKSKLRNMCVELDKDDVMRATGRYDRHQSLDAEKRLKAYEPPFNCSAIYYFGPMIVTVGRRTEKRWGVLITCLTTRVVHLEIAAGLTPSSAILSLRRFIARRGTPTVMYSDNATNITKSDNELREAASEVEMYATAKRIVWKFIPPGALDMGRTWERMIRTIKSSLYAVLKERKPREETLHTLLLEVEHIINSRPMTQVEPNLNREALTPNHFLFGRSCGVSPIAGHLEPKVGDPVLIADKTMPRGLCLEDELSKQYQDETTRCNQCKFLNKVKTAVIPPRPFPVAHSPRINRARRHAVIKRDRVALDHGLWIAEQLNLSESSCGLRFLVHSQSARSAADMSMPRAEMRMGVCTRRSSISTARRLGTSMHSHGTAYTALISFSL
ncbi:hypothetical protein EVAR_34656_1 [Eumeta japonica]|uniref:Integrase catalytic domain-containing protein n=1 Tax=Eumeta variegata TaxID=151549 RepID=A0A4C1VG69_EUMVA|nr:hypothetical protein EVAR_34656_1 [Eumeta japonica]